MGERRRRVARLLCGLVLGIGCLVAGASAAREATTREGVAIATADGVVNLGPSELVHVEPIGIASRLTCGGRELLVDVGASGAIMWVDGERFELTQARAASGAKFEAPDDPDTWFWSKGEAALVSLGGELLPACVLAVWPAEEPFRGRGNEPGWHLEIARDRIVLVTDYGRDRREAPRPPAEFEPGAMVYEVAEWDARIRLEPKLCRDDMTGMPYPATVTVDLPERTLRGCGGEAATLLIGPVWVAEAIMGRGVADAARASLDFRPDGRLAGRASCNRYTAAYALTGESLTIAPAATTRMACAEAVMDQETRFLAALGEVGRFDVDAGGALLLLTVGGEVAIRAVPE